MTQKNNDDFKELKLNHEKVMEFTKYNAAIRTLQKLNKMNLMRQHEAEKAQELINNTLHRLGVRGNPEAGIALEKAGVSPESVANNLSYKNWPQVKYKIELTNGNVGSTDCGNVLHTNSIDGYKICERFENYPRAVYFYCFGETHRTRLDYFKRDYLDKINLK